MKIFDTFLMPIGGTLSPIGRSISLLLGSATDMWQWLVFLSTCLVLFPIAAVGASPDNSIEGYWVNGDKNQIIEVSPCEIKPERVCGKIVWQTPDDANFEAPPTGGGVVLQNFVKRGKYWLKGTFPENERHWRLHGRISKLTNGDMKIGRCNRNVCRNEIWQRLEKQPAIFAAFHKCERAR